MHLLDSAFIFVMALVLFGPKKLPEIARQMGKLLAEFRRASNEFKLQMDEELRSMEQKDQQERQNKLAQAATPSEVPSPDGASMLTILPPSTGEQVPIASPYAEAMAAEEASIAEGAILEEAAASEEHSIEEQPPAINDAQPAAAEEASIAEGAMLEAAPASEEHSIEEQPLPVNDAQPTALPADEQASLHHG